MKLFNHSILLASLYLTCSVLASTSSSASSTSCDPLSATTCSPDKALGTSISEQFTKSSSYFDISSTTSGVAYTEDGVKLTLAKRYDDPSLKSNFYIMFGRVEFSLKAANGTGIVSSFFLQSDDLDEIDCEWFGGDVSQMQSNYFSKGNTTLYNRGEYHTMSSPQDEFHNYTLDWTYESLTWYIDGTAVRTLSNDSSEGYPQTPMFISMGIWAGGDSSNAEGTIEWAGGETDYSDAPFSMYVNYVSVNDYSSGTEYSYSGQSGDWTSIKATDGEVNGRVDSDSTSESSDTSSASSASLSSSSSSASLSSSSTATPSSASASVKGSSTTSASASTSSFSTSSGSSTGSSSSTSHASFYNISGSSNSNSSSGSSSSSNVSQLTTLSTTKTDSKSSSTSPISSSSASSNGTSSINSTENNGLRVGGFMNNYFSVCIMLVISALF